MRRGAGTRDGKKFDEWEIYKNTRHIKVQVRMHKGRTIHFSAECPELDLKWKSFEDINALQAKVKEDILAHETIEFVPMIEVVFLKERNRSVWSLSGADPKIMPVKLLTDPAFTDGDIRAELDLHVKFFLRSEKPVGKENYRWRPGLAERDQYLVKNNLNAQGQLETWPEMDDDDEDVTVWLDDTIENRIALEEIRSGINRLRARLVEMLLPDNIALTIKLINTRGIGLLPAATTEKSK